MGSCCQRRAGVGYAGRMGKGGGGSHCRISAPEHRGGPPFWLYAPPGHRGAVRAGCGGTLRVRRMAVGSCMPLRLPAGGPRGCGLGCEPRGHTGLFYICVFTCPRPRMMTRKGPLSSSAGRPVPPENFECFCDDDYAYGHLA